MSGRIEPPARPASPRDSIEIRKNRRGDPATVAAHILKRVKNAKA